MKPRTPRQCCIGPREAWWLVEAFNREIHPSEFSQWYESFEGAVWTNNPYLVDCFAPEEILYPNHRSMSEHPQWKKWKDELTTGEFWTMFGDEW